jgi:proton glutamate symport protein
MLRTLRKVTLTQWIFVGMAVGILVGWLDNSLPDRDFSPYLKPLSTIFLRLIKSIVVPLIFGTLVVGIAGHGDDLKQIGRLALRSIGYFWLMTSIALAVGLLAGNLVQPGVGVNCRRVRRGPSAGSWSTWCRRAFSRPRPGTRCCRSCSGACSSPWPSPG